MKPTRSFTAHLSELLTQSTGSSVQVMDSTPIGGGSINDAYRLITTEGSFFLKTNTADHNPSYFEAEADGLERLRSSGTIRTPSIIAQDAFEDVAYLLLEFIPPGTPTPAFWTDFGTRMANLHRTTSDRFGLDRPNYIGTLMQTNDQEASWSDFLVQHRLEPLVRSGRDSGKVDGGIALRFERLYGRLDGLFPKEPPALLHGDLWYGNHLCPEEGSVVLVDPAVYFGHREMDLAMARSFGGFDEEFHRSYHASWPLEEGWESRVELCNLYPLLVHVILFGGGYAEQVRSILKRWT